MPAPPELLAQREVGATKSVPYEFRPYFFYIKKIGPSHKRQLAACDPWFSPDLLLMQRTICIKHMIIRIEQTISTHTELFEVMADIEEPEETRVCVNYAANKSMLLLRSNEVLGIIEDADAHVVLFGEGNFSHAMALERWRKYQDKGAVNVTATTYSTASLECKPLIAVAKATKHAVLYRQTCEQDYTNFPAVDSVPNGFGQHFISGVDATAIPEIYVSRDHRNIFWFHCPWIAQNEEGDTDALVSGFLYSAAQRLPANSWALLGFTNSFPYTQAYGLQNIFKEDGSLSEHWAVYFEFCGADTTAMKTMLACGYKHLGRYEIHNTIISTHVVLAFKRIENKQK